MKEKTQLVKGHYKTVWVDQEVWNMIVEEGKFSETPNRVLRRLLGLSDKPTRRRSWARDKE